MTVKAKDAKSFIMGSALMLTGVFECLEQIEEGKGLFESASTAVQLTKKRGEVIAKAAKDMAEEEAPPKRRRRKKRKVEG